MAPLLTVRSERVTNPIHAMPQKRGFTLKRLCFSAQTHVFQPNNGKNPQNQRSNVLDGFWFSLRETFWPLSFFHLHFPQQLQTTSTTRCQFSNSRLSQPYRFQGFPYLVATLLSNLHNLHQSLNFSLRASHLVIWVLLLLLNCSTSDQIIHFGN